MNSDPNYRHRPLNYRAAAFTCPLCTSSVAAFCTADCADPLVVHGHGVCGNCGRCFDFTTRVSPGGGTVLVPALHLLTVPLSEDTSNGYDCSPLDISADDFGSDGHIDAMNEATQNSDRVHEAAIYDESLEPEVVEPSDPSAYAIFSPTRAMDILAIFDAATAAMKLRGH